MKDDKKHAGHIGSAGPQQGHVAAVSIDELRKKVKALEIGALVLCDATFDVEHARLLLTGKHPMIVGQERVLILPVVELLQILGPVLATYVIPIMAAQRVTKPANGAT